MKITKELLTPELSHEGLPYLRQHAEDTYAKWGLPEGSTTVDPDWATFLAQQDAGDFFMVTARDDEGKLRGYVGVSLRQHPHIHVRYAYIECIFFDRELRGTVASAAMMDYTCKMSLSKGAKFVYLSAPMALAAHLEKQGWKPVEVGCIFTAE